MKKIRMRMLLTLLFFSATALSESRIMPPKNLCPESERLTDSEKAQLKRLATNRYMKQEINAEDDSGNRPLMYAIERRDIEAVKLLFFSGAEIFEAQNKDTERKIPYVNGKGETLLMAAIKSGRSDIYNLVLKKIMEVAQHEQSYYQGFDDQEESEYFDTMMWIEEELFLNHTWRHE